MPLGRGAFAFAKACAEAAVMLSSAGRSCCRLRLANHVATGCGELRALVGKGELMVDESFEGGGVKDGRSGGRADMSFRQSEVKDDCFAL